MKIDKTQKFKCPICSREYFKGDWANIVAHLKKKHSISSKEYYDEYLKKETDGICKNCGKETRFLSISKGYKETCSFACTNMLKYGVDNPWKAKEVKEKIKDTNRKRYGVDFAAQSAQMKQASRKTFIEKYGVDNPWKAEEVKEKIKQTNLERRGVEYSSQDPSTREKFKETCNQRYGGVGWASKELQEKMKQTSLENYGVEDPSHSKEAEEKRRKTFENKYGEGVTCPFVAKEVQEKIKQTNLDKHGVSNPWKSKKIRDKIKKTNLKKFNVDNPWKAKEVINKIKNTKTRNLQTFEKENDVILLKKLNLDYTHRVSKDLDTIEFKDRLFIKNSDIKLAKELDKKYREDAKVYNSKYEAEIHSWLSSIYSGEILVNKYGIIKDDTKKQLDFYIPEKRLAIEFNGDFVHSANYGKSADYHLNKTNLCSEQGIRLIHIFEHEWLTKQDILKSIISSALGIYKTRVYARKCEVREVSSSEARIFLETNHLQGFIPSSDRVGLYYNNELIQLLCFGKNRFKRDEIELLRMCTKLDTQVVGGFSKLLKYQPYEEFISYVDLSKFSANGYLKNSFEIISQSSPNYKYIKGERVLNRLRAQKHKLPKLLGDNFDASKTESENMQDAGWWKVYDCGNLKLLYSRS